MVSSYDRRTVSPDKDWWYANDDGFGCMRVDTVQGRVEKVMFDYDGPGAVTRIWMSAHAKMVSSVFILITKRILVL